MQHNFSQRISKRAFFPVHARFEGLERKIKNLQRNSAVLVFFPSQLLKKKSFFQFTAEFPMEFSGELLSDLSSIPLHRFLFSSLIFQRSRDRIYSLILALDQN